MLAQNFKTAEDLHISDKEHSALIQVLHALERGELKHVILERVDGYCYIYIVSTQDSAFNMASFECGTARCIGGWARHFGISRDEQWINLGRASGLRKLYYPDENYIRNDITVAQAAYALRSFLTTGDSKWAEAIKIKD